MRVEAIVIGILAAFAAVVAPIYWWLSGDWSGSSALVMTALLGILLSFFLAVLAKQIPERPEDDKLAEISDGAGELGFFPPFSWWPLFSAGAISVIAIGLIFGWWLFIIGVGLGATTLLGFVFEFYRGHHAH